MTSKIKVFIYTDRLSQRVLAVKLARSADFSLNGADFVTHTISTSLPFPRNCAFSHTYDPVAGLRALGQPPLEEMERLTLLRRKIDILLLLKFNLAIVRRDIAATFASKKLREFPVSERNFKIFWSFMIEERSLLLKRLRGFSKEVLTSLDQAQDKESVERVAHWLTGSKSVGFFSATAENRVINELASS